MQMVSQSLQSKPNCNDCLLEQKAPHSLEDFDRTQNLRLLSMQTFQDNIQNYPTHLQPGKPDQLSKGRDNQQADANPRATQALELSDEDLKASIRSILHGMKMNILEMDEKFSTQKQKS